MSETNMSDFESQFNEQPEVAELVAFLGETAKESQVITIDGEEAVSLSSQFITEISDAMKGNPRCTTIEDCIIIRLDPDLDSDALDQPNLKGVREIHAVSGPVPGSDAETFWDKAAIKIKNSDGVDTMYEMEHGMPPLIHTIHYDMDGEQSFHAARLLDESDRGQLADVVKALDVARE